MGGGKVLDVGKYASSMSKRPFISVPTSISHDGVASPIAVLKCDHNSVRSLDCKIPSYIIMDLDIIKNGARKLILAGLGDLVSNITALKDWERAVQAGKAKMDDFAYIISGTAVRAILQYTHPDIRDTAFLTQLAESVVLSGLAMNITGNTRPSSGAEHLIKPRDRRGWERDAARAAGRGGEAYWWNTFTAGIMNLSGITSGGRAPGHLRSLGFMTITCRLCAWRAPREKQVYRS